MILEALDLAECILESWAAAVEALERMETKCLSM